MLTGYNTDFKFQGKIYHVQTEDGGINNPFITSLLYHQGAILASRKTGYADIIKADCLEEVVRELMMEQHKRLIRDLMHGNLESKNSAQPAQEAVHVTEPPAASTPQEAVHVTGPPAAATPKEAAYEKSIDDIIQEFLEQEPKGQGQKK